MKRAVVIGAGACGLPTVKSCLEEGLVVVCYEASDGLGGVWRYTEDVRDCTTSVFSSVVLNVNKEMMAYSDFPPPLALPTYPRHSQWLQYLETYAAHFRLTEHVRLRHRVLSVERADDYAATGRWRVKVEHEGRVFEDHFDLVLVATGHHVYPHVPEFPGQERYSGRIVHSKTYRTPEGYRGKNVIVVGFGNSAVDIANDICSGTKQTYLSTRRKGWVIPRVWDGRKLTINELYRRSFTLPYKFLPESWLQKKEEELCNSAFDHDWLNVKPKHRISAQRPVINDVLPLNLLNGTILLRPGIQEFTEEGLIFQGEDAVTKADVVLLATGFEPLFPFLKGMENANDYIDKMYKRMFPAHLPHNTLIFVGLLDPDYSVPASAEMQSRWAVAVYKGKVKLPEREKMLLDAQKVQKNLKESTYEGFAQKTMIHAPPYVEELAAQLGVGPSLLKLFFTDFALFRGVFFGPLLPYQFRLRGPHAWKGAREAILGAESRDVYHLSRSFRDNRGRRRCRRLFKLFLGSAVAVFLVLRYQRRLPPLVPPHLIKELLGRFS